MQLLRSGSTSRTRRISSSDRHISSSPSKTSTRPWSAGGSRARMTSHGGRICFDSSATSCEQRKELPVPRFASQRFWLRVDWPVHSLYQRRPLPAQPKHSAEVRYLAPCAPSQARSCRAAKGRTRRFAKPSADVRQLRPGAIRWNHFTAGLSNLQVAHRRDRLLRMQA